MVKINPITGYSRFEEVHHDLLSAPKPNSGFSFTRWAFEWIHFYDDVDWKLKYGTNMFDDKKNFHTPGAFLKQILHFVVIRVFAAAMPIFAFLDILQSCGKAIWHLCKRDLKEARHHFLICRKVCGIFAASIPLIPLVLSSPAKVYLSDQRWDLTRKQNLALDYLEKIVKEIKEWNNGPTADEYVQKIDLIAEKMIELMPCFVKSENFSTVANILSQLKGILLNYETEPSFGEAKFAIDLAYSCYTLSSPSLSFINYRSAMANKLLCTYKENKYVFTLNDFATMEDYTGPVPFTEIFQLAQLKQLNLNRSRLRNLPSEIGKLSDLKHLFLYKNNLETLPSDISQLSQLKFLDLGENKLRNFPPEIVQLSELKFLELQGNKLKTFPPQIEQLSNLVMLRLDYNNFETLPSEIGQLSKLKTLDLSHNKKLKDLPLSLGQIPELINIHIEGTGIPPAMRDAILNQCKALREEKALEILPTRLHSWKVKSKIEVDLSGVNQFDEKQKKSINEWMVRLENTKDFNSKFQSVLAETVCRMLEDCTKNKEFRELFFVQIESNLECCEDRIAMALNEIYTTWKLTQLNDQAPLNEKLQMMWRGAKTIALRAAIAEKIDEHQKQTKKVEEEAVEIYLYYEILLSKKLNLLSIINKMAYETIGKRDWIKEADVIETVNQTSLDHLIELSNFETMAKNDEAYVKEYKAQVEPLDAKMDTLLEYVPNADQFSEVYLNWQSQVGELNSQRKDVVLQIKKQWAKEKLSV